MVDKIVGNDFGRTQFARRARRRDAPSQCTGPLGSELQIGEVAEWSNALVLKTSKGL